MTVGEGSHKIEVSLQSVNLRVVVVVLFVIVVVVVLAVVLVFFIGSVS